MRSPAAAIAWELFRRHRWGFAALLLYFAVLAAVRVLLLGPGGRVLFEDDWQFALGVVVPLSSSVAYLLAVFSFGLQGDLASRRSIYPARMFTLPVTDDALVGWPMLYGTVAMAVLWLLTRLLAIWPAGTHVPWIWPALFGAVFLAWTQALTWRPYALRGLRVLVTVLWLAAIGFVVLLALELKASEGAMLALLAPHLPFAYLLARRAVVRARRGDGPGERFGRIREHVPRRVDPFGSPVRAQAWLEWRRFGRSLPVLVGLVLPFELSLLFVFHDTSVFVLETLAAVLLTPPFLAVFVAATVRSGPDGKDAYELTPFLAKRPLTSVSLVRAKLAATIRSTLVTWTLVLAVVALALGLSGASATLFDLFHRLAEAVGTSRAVAAAVLGLVALVVSTWKQLVQGLYIGLSGRAWLVKASVFATLALVSLLLPLVLWAIRRRDVIAALWSSLPWVLTVLACCKVSAAAWIAARLYDGGLVSRRAIVLGALFWNFAVLALCALLVWLLPTLLFRTYLLALVAVLAVPLARLAAAPLALAWNRHR